MSESEFHVSGISLFEKHNERRKLWLISLFIDGGCMYLSFIWNMPICCYFKISVSTTLCK